MTTERKLTTLEALPARVAITGLVSDDASESAAIERPATISGTEPGRLPRSVISPEVARTWDRLFNAAMAKSTAGLDPRVIHLAFLDWWVKLAWSPGTHARLTEKGLRKWARIGLFLAQGISDRE